MSEPSPRVERKRTGQLSGVQVMFATILAVGLLLAINFSSRITAGQPLQRAYDRVRAEIDILEQEQARLLAERDYARSDAYVESWARDEGKMVRSGEVLVIPVPLNPTPEDTQEPERTVAVETGPPQPAPWTIWWALFFDSPPPALN